MTQQVDQYRRVVDLLVSRTLENKIDWSWHKESKSCTSWFGNNAIRIIRGQNGNYEELYTVQIHNNSQEILESFTDEDLDYGEADVTIQHTYFLILQELYTAVQKRVTGADVALASILADLESGRDLKDDIPF